MTASPRRIEHIIEPEPVIEGAGVLPIEQHGDIETLRITGGLSGRRRIRQDLSASGSNCIGTCSTTFAHSTEWRPEPDQVDVPLGHGGFAAWPCRRFRSLVSLGGFRAPRQSGCGIRRRFCQCLERP